MNGPNVVVKTVKGDRAAARLIEQMTNRGYQLEGQSSRKVLYSLTTGVFTRKQKHTLTFVKERVAASPTAGRAPMNQKMRRLEQEQVRLGNWRPRA